ncbi:MAG: SdrD B-like domain-containing protein [Nitrosomonadales bacterium]
MTCSQELYYPLAAVGVNYNYGELGAKLSGTVYYDANDNGVMDGADTGLTNVTLTLSGTTASGVSVCTLVTCIVTTASDGTFSYVGLPAANATGYKLVETQPVDYANRTDTVGTGCGGANCGTASVVGGNSQFAGINLTVGANAINYYFGEKTGTISGFVYLDANDNGIKDTGETGISGITLTLSGTTLSGAAVCTTCTTTTAADGSYSFTGVKNANGTGYTITETQPGAYLHGKVNRRHPTRDGRQYSLYWHSGTEQHFGGRLQCCQRRHRLQFWPATERLHFRLRLCGHQQ